MVVFGVVQLLLKLTKRLLFDHPDNFRFLAQRITEHNPTGQGIDQHFNKRKLGFYSRIATIAYTCLEQLNGKKVLGPRKESMLLVCGISPILDDLMDEKGYSGHEILQITNKISPDSTVEERVAVGLLDDLDARAPEIRSSEIWEKAIGFQVESHAQIHRKLTQPEVAELTFGKGGNIVLLGMLASVPELISTENGQAAFFRVGALIQFVDDIFDVWKDREEGQQTLLTTCGDIAELSRVFDEMLAETDGFLKKLPLPKRRVNTFLFEIKAFTSLGRVALNQLIDLQNKSGGKFSIEKYTRQELVTDMDLWQNRVAYLKLVFGK